MRAELRLGLAKADYPKRLLNSYTLVGRVGGKKNSENNDTNDN